MAIRTDLAVESAEQSGAHLPEGVERECVKKDGVAITTVRVVSEAGAKAIGKPLGQYITIEADNMKSPAVDYDAEIEALAAALTELLPKEGTVLVAGLGNSDITPDALGPKTAAHTFATRHIGGQLAAEAGLSDLRPVAVLATGVLGQTGMESAEIIAAVCESVKPSAVVVIDALACSGIERLGTTVQITDTGISPGSGVQNRRKELSQASLGIPVIAVGVPTVVDMTTIAQDLFGAEELPAHSREQGRAMMVTPREIDVLIDRAAKLLGLGINRALQPSLSIDELAGLVS